MPRAYLGPALAVVLIYIGLSHFSEYRKHQRDLFVAPLVSIHIKGYYDRR